MKRLGPNRNTHSGDTPASQGNGGDLARGDPEAREEYNGRRSTLGGGDSGGGAYPNPHRGKKPDNDGFMGHGGQTEMGYHGHGQLGDVEVDGGNSNAPAKAGDSIKGKPRRKSGRTGAG